MSTTDGHNEKLSQKFSILITNMELQTLTSSIIVGEVAECSVRSKFSEGKLLGFESKLCYLIAMKSRENY